VVDDPEKISPSYRTSLVTLAVRQTLYVKVLFFVVLVIIANKGSTFYFHKFCMLFTPVMLSFWALHVDALQIQSEVNFEKKG